ncbi:uncharacterized protein [Phaseolus vulgaris]|uniref:uncharacterized protein isoform X5 n=1 Tax=Phaseolus vulgaris TaxID=3885 RepID=UPI0035CB18D7
MKLVAEIWSHDFGKIQCIKGRQRQRWPNILMPLSPYQKMTVVEDKMDDPRDKFPIGMRVLAFDDESTCLMILETMLRRCEYQGYKPSCSLSRVVGENNFTANALQTLTNNLCYTYQTLEMVLHHLIK